jgi:hypothetical protein
MRRLNVLWFRKPITDVVPERNFLPGGFAKGFNKTPDLGDGFGRRA